MLAPTAGSHGVVLQLRVKMISKILGNTSFVFLYFLLFLYYSVNTLIGTKTEYDVAGISRNTVVLPYRSFSDWLKKSNNFLDFLHCSSGLSCTVHLDRATIFFLLIQRVFKYSNDLNL
jgi:hypothetical protein